MPKPKFRTFMISIDRVLNKSEMESSLPAKKNGAMKGPRMTLSVQNPNALPFDEASPVVSMWSGACPDRPKKAPASISCSKLRWDHKLG